MISADVEREILRLYHAEKWRPGTIADALGVHFVTVKRVLEREGQTTEKIPRASLVDPYLPFIHRTLERFPKLTAARLYAMVKERGYKGRPSHFRDIIAKIRPRKPTEAFLRLRTAAGDQGQVDWGHFGTIQVGQAERPLMAFVIVLSYSRAIFLRFFPGQHTSYFLEGHQDAFHAWNGCPRNLLYDNLKSVVISRPTASTIEFNQDFTDFAAHYRFRPIPVGVRRGNEKGRVERAIRYIRSSFFAARPFKDIADLNDQAERWANGPAMERPWPDNPKITVAEAYVKDQAALMSLRDTTFPCEERREIRVGKTPYARFDRNDYSVPHTHVRKLVVARADLRTVRITFGNDVIATHSRSFDSHLTIEDPEHIERLVAEKRRATKERSTDVVVRSVPSSEEFLKRALQNKLALGAVVRQLRECLDAYGAQAVEHAVKEALQRGVVNSHGVLHILEAKRIRAGEAPPVPMNLPDDERIRDLRVDTHSLNEYDGLSKEEDGNDER